MTFRALSGDSPDPLTTVARFLALLELFREGAVSFDQVTPLGELTVRWTGGDDDDVEITDEFDGAPDPATPTPLRRPVSHSAGRAACRGGRDGSAGATSRTETVRHAEDETLDVPLVDLRPALEAVLMVADQPLDHLTLASAVGHPPDEVAAALDALAAEYAEQDRGFDLRNVAGGWRYYTREEYAAVVERFVLDGQQARLTQAALETLAVVAYKQPVSRARVSAIRGVNVDGVMRTLLTRGLVEEAGHDAETDRDALPDHGLLPGADRRDLAGRAARAGAVPARRWPTSTTPTSGPRRRPRRVPSTTRDRMSLETDDEGLIRLQKLLAQSGVASRRKCEELMLAGLVEVDGEVVTRLGTKVDPTTAVIRVDGKRLPPVSPHVYLVLNKPRGVVSTMSDPEGRRTLSDFVADRPERLFHVGRLDTDTEGLILLTNDGDFAQRVAHPSYELDKTYVAEVDGVVSQGDGPAGCSTG